MHRIEGEVRNIKRRAKLLMHFLTISCTDQSANVDKATRSANEWLGDELVEPEPVSIELTKDRTQVVTMISLRSLSSLNRKHAPHRFAGFTEHGRPMFNRRAS